MTIALLAASALLRAQPDFEVITMTIRGEERKAIIVRPTGGKEPHPVIFGFHGHGGNGRNAARSFNLHSAWPEAVTLYPFGLPTATPRDLEGAKPGWDGSKESRDLVFFDSLLYHVIHKEKGDAKKVFVMGHSNGGGFVYALWRNRGSLIAGVAPCAAAGARVGFDVEPKPAFLMMGRKDAIVPFESQLANLDAVLGVNVHQRSATPPPPSFQRTIGRSELKYWAGRSPTGVYTHPGGHEFPAQAVKPMVQFFKRSL